MNEPRVYKLPFFLDRDGVLTVADGADLPFVPRRAFWIDSMPEGARRGGHAHRACHQFAVALSGIVQIETVTTDGKIATWDLNDPSLALHIPPLVWDTVVAVTAGAFVFVLASEPYLAEDYIESMQDFLAIGA